MHGVPLHGVFGSRLVSAAARSLSVLRPGCRWSPFPQGTCESPSPSVETLPRCAALQAHHAVSDVASDFYAGVQAALITRSGSPAWSPPSLTDVRKKAGGRVSLPAG